MKKHPSKFIQIILTIAIEIVGICACTFLFNYIPSRVAQNLPSQPITREVTRVVEVSQILPTAVSKSPDTQSPNSPEGELATVNYIVDGDTIDVELEGKTYRIRYIGMDTPERGDYFFTEATEANRRLVEGQQVIMVKDVSETDRYGRLLRYIYLQDGTFVNAELVEQGYALPATFPPDVRHQSLFLKKMREAREAGRGLWAQPKTTDPQRINSHLENILEPGNCDAAYPTICIPSPPPDLNCPQIPFRNFTVLEPDPHNFDGDGDGVGCER